mgnify:FL=1
MALFVISDLHLSFGTDKPMDIFGWNHYEEKLRENWSAVVEEKDTVLIPGDISWATYLEETEADFAFIDSLPGQKIILKGNHDYWWTTVKKMNQFLLDKGFSSLHFLYNNSFSYGRYAICGTRGWGNNGDRVEDNRIWSRELQRLQLSLEAAKDYDGVICCLHYPPFDLSGNLSGEYMELFYRYGVEMVCYGHIHTKKPVLPLEAEGIQFRLTSCDYLQFAPLFLKD